MSIINPCVFPAYRNISDASDPYTGGRPALDVILGKGAPFYDKNGSINSAEVRSFTEKLTNFAISGARLRNKSGKAITHPRIDGILRGNFVFGWLFKPWIPTTNWPDYLYTVQVWRDQYTLLDTKDAFSGSLEETLSIYSQLFELAKTHDLYVRLSNDPTTDILLVTSESTDGVTTFNFTLLPSK
jgi:hypothetical protein